MGLRFRRSVKLAPGLRLNFSGNGLSFTAGPRGASVNFGKRGTFLNTGIPGTGLYSRSRLDAVPATASRVLPPGKVSVSVSVTLKEDGTLVFEDANGQPLSDSLITSAKRQKGAEIRALIEQTAAKINTETKALAKIHIYTPQPADGEQYHSLQFEIEAPKKPTDRQVGLIDRLLGRRRRIEDESEQAQRRYKEALAAWKVQKAAFEAEQAAEGVKFANRLRSDVDFMQSILEQNLTDISWPRETQVSFEVEEGGRSVSLDVDLPEIEDFKVKTASVPARGYKLTLKDLKDKDQKLLYAQHVHGVGFRIIGEVFATLPTVQRVTLSAYTQRSRTNTGHVADTYVYSVRIFRDKWEAINFSALEAVDVVEAFERFQLLRKISRSGIMEAVGPFESLRPTNQGAKNESG